MYWAVVAVLGLVGVAIGCTPDVARVEQLDANRAVVATLEGEAVSGPSSPGWMGPSGRVALENIPTEMQSGAYGHYPNQPCPLEVGTQFRLTCPGTCGLSCSFFLVVYHCSTCSRNINGGYPGLLPPRGWAAGSCAPRFQIAAGEKWHRMTSFHRHVAAGKWTDTPVTEKDLMYMAIFSKPLKMDCSQYDADQSACSQRSECRWEQGGICFLQWCPHRPPTPGSGTSGTAPVPDCTPCAPAPACYVALCASPTFTLPEEVAYTNAGGTNLGTKTFGGGFRARGWVYLPELPEQFDRVYDFKVDDLADDAICLFFRNGQTWVYTRRGFITTMIGVLALVPLNQWFEISFVLVDDGKTVGGQKGGTGTLISNGVSKTDTFPIPNVMERKNNFFGGGAGVSGGGNLKGALRDWEVCFDG